MISSNGYKIIKRLVLVGFLLMVLLRSNSKSTQGNNWTNWGTVVVSTEGAGDSQIPVLALDHQGNLHITWFEDTNTLNSGTDYDIFYRYWNVSNGVWSTIEVVSTESTSNSQNPTMVLDSKDNVHIAWDDLTPIVGSGSDLDILYKYKNATTDVWATTQLVSNESTAASFGSSLAVDLQDNLHISWSDITDYANSGADYDIFYKYKNVSTSVWNTTEVVSTESTSNSFDPSLVVDGQDNIHIAWEDLTDFSSSGTDYDIFYKYQNVSTGIWNTTEVVSTQSSGNSQNPTMALDSQDNVHAAWDDRTDYASSGTDFDIFYKYQNVSTGMWSTTEVVSTQSSGNSQNPTMALDSQDNVHTAWDDLTPIVGSGSDLDIVYKYKNANNGVWLPSDVVSTESTSLSLNPNLALDRKDNVHIAWHDGTNYASASIDLDIFYKQAINLNAIPTTVTDTITETETNTQTNTISETDTIIETITETGTITEISTITDFETTTKDNTHTETTTEVTTSIDVISTTTTVISSSVSTIFEKITSTIVTTSTSETPYPLLYSVITIIGFKIVRLRKSKCSIYLD